MSFFANSRGSLGVFRILYVASFVLLSVSGCTATREQEIEGDVNEFRSWVNAQTNKVAERSEEDWEATKADFRQRTEELDRKQERFSEKLRADYQQIKADFEERERERDGLSDKQARLAQWERDLLGLYANGASMSVLHVDKAYATFMGNVRTRHQSWGEEEWEMAEMVLEELNQRKEAFDDLPDETEVRIKSLQMEFEALREGDASN